MPSNENLQQFIISSRVTLILTKTAKCIMRTVDKNISHHFLQTPHFFCFCDPVKGRWVAKERGKGGTGKGGMGKGKGSAVGMMGGTWGGKRRVAKMEKMGGLQKMMTYVFVNSSQQLF